MSMIRKKARTESRPEHRLKNCPKTGNARSAWLKRVSLLWNTFIYIEYREIEAADPLVEHGIRRWFHRLFPEQGQNNLLQQK